MAISLSNESKNTAVTLSKESKVTDDKTWDESTFTWESEQAQLETWERTGYLTLTKESKT